LEQATIFHHARMIVALHGAGLTNIIYCQPNVKIIEILNPNLFEPLYFFIAHLLGLQYHSVMANENHTLIKREKDIKGTVSIDPEKLEACLISLQVSNPVFH
jgi:capsular polysaccharide biosynthesis protein